MTELTQSRSSDLAQFKICRRSRSNNPVQKLPIPGNSGDFVEAVFRPENFRTFSDDFRPVPAGKHRKLTGINQKNLDNVRSEYCFHVLAISGVFLPDSVTFSNLFCRIPRDPVAGITDLGREEFYEF